MVLRLVILSLLSITSLYSLSELELKEKIELCAKEYLKQNNAAGVAIAVVKNSFTTEEVYQKSFYFGFSTRAQKSPIRESTLFRIGSLSKTFTALLFAHLLEEKKIRFDEEAGVYLPKTFSVPSYHGKSFTLLDLLLNLSSLPNMPTIPLRHYQVSWVEIENYFRKHKLCKKPGTQYESSDLGYALLAHIASRMNRVSYEKLLQEKILQPLSLHSTHYSIPLSRMHLVATGYRGIMVVKEDFLDREGSFFKPCRGLVSSIGDMKTWLTVFLKMSKSSLEASVKHIYKSSYSFPDGRKKASPGWEIEPMSFQKPLPMYHEEGLYQGFSHCMAFTPDTKAGVAVLSNSEYDVKSLAVDILHLLHE